jgi:hypothetical protein
MIPLAIGALLAVAAMVWVIAPIFGGESRGGADDAAEAAIRKWREPVE